MKNKYTALSVVLALASAAFSGTASAQAIDTTALARRIADAKPGQTINLTAGTFAMGIKLPPGVSLRGAGYDKTIIDASAAMNGIEVSGGTGAAVTDLTVRGAANADILAQNAQRVTLSRVRVTGSLLGVNFSGVTAGRIENVICDNNRYGIVVTGGMDNTVVNCTLAKNASLGLSFASGTHDVAFNNVVTDSAVCIYLGNQAAKVMADHNLYLGLFAGKFHDQLVRNTVGAWSYLSGQDHHSVHLPVVYVGPSDFHPTNLLAWSQERVATSDWGVVQFGGVTAPTADIDGKGRVGAPDLGAYEIAPKPDRPADGVLSVQGGNGLTSAGVFTPDGTAMTYLFQNMPLAKGTYKFWLPSRTYQGQPIVAGKYEVRMVESNLNWEYLGWFGNSFHGASLVGSVAAPTCVDRIALDEAGHMIAGKSPSEDHISLRGFEAASGDGLWSFQGGDQMRGLATGPDGLVYVFRSGKTDDQIRLIRVEPGTGKLVPWRDPTNIQVMMPTAKNVDGIAVLSDTIYFADAPANKLWFGPTAQPALTGGFDIAGPSSPSADTQAKLIWLISGGTKVVALSPDGKVVAESDRVPAPAALAVRDGRLAVASRTEGKIYVFDVSDPGHWKPIQTIGRGDGPYGPIVPDRFRFQSAPNNENSTIYLSLGPKNVLAVADLNRILLFDENGKVLNTLFGMWGSGTTPSNVVNGRVWDYTFNQTFRLDGAAKTWKPEAYWQFDAPEGHTFDGDFSVGGKTFAVFRDFKSNVWFMRFDGYKTTPVLAFFLDPKTNQTTVRRDSNHDGKIDASDDGTLLVDADGKPVTEVLFSQGNEYVTAKGDFVIFAGSSHGAAVSWPCAGLDSDGVPVYKWSDVFHYPRGEAFSPYNFEKFSADGIAGGVSDEAGGLIGPRSLPGSPNMALVNVGGSDIMAFRRDGSVRWVKDMSEYGHVSVLVGENSVYVAGIGPTTELAAMNRDGLGLGSFCWPERANSVDCWYDHRQAAMSYKGEDGRFYLTTTDFIQNLNHWFRLDETNIHESRAPLVIGNNLTAKLAALPAFDPAALVVKPTTPTVRIAHIDHDLVIDGDLGKWRTAGIAPQIIITPDTAAGVKSPKVASAVIRLAYHDGALYGQILRFCNVVVMDQPAPRAYLQDTVEMSLNGFIEGFKFNITKTIDHGDIIQRQSWHDTPETLLKPEDAPRIVKVLDNARDVEERKMIETIYGVDMSDCKVIVYEFKLPIDKTTYSGGDGESRIFPLGPGKEFRIGFMIDDNDQIGSDVQNILVWPATYATFAHKEASAIATCE